MRKYYITGSSRGIGLALTELLLKNQETEVVGISRTKVIEHDNYTHIPIDLEHAEALMDIADDLFHDLSGYEEVVLINNAGYMGKVQYLGDLPHEEFIKVMQVNVISVGILMNAFIRKLGDTACRKIILNLGSGAGKHPYDGWAAYCASKAALDMLSEAATMENDIRGKGIRIVSLAPGPVETEMQEVVRATDTKHFSQVKKFLDLKDSGKLPSSGEVAKKILAFIDNIDQIDGPIQDLRNLDLS